MIEAGDISYVGEIMFEGTSDGLIGCLRRVFESEVGGNAVSYSRVIYFERKNWRVVEASKAVRRELGSRVRSRCTRNCSNELDHLLYWLERSKRKEGVDINVRLGSTTVIYKAAKRMMMILDGRVSTWDQRV